MKRIGLFGGTFDPVHLGHTKLAKKVLSQFGLDKIIFIPAGAPPHKLLKKRADKIHRFNMVKLATEEFPFFEVSDFEVLSETPSYSYLTISHFKEKYPDDEIFFIVGADSFRDFPEWKNYETLISLCKFIVVSRPGITPENYYEKYKTTEKLPEAEFVDDAFFNFSSTEIRNNIIQNKPVSELLSKKVYDYIKTNKLYI